MSHLWWIPLPGGLDAAGNGVLRLLVIPVLDAAADTVPFTWPPVGLDGAVLSVDVDAGTTAPSGTVITSTVTARLSVVPSAWQEFFGSISVEEPRQPVTRTIDVTQTQQQYLDVRHAYAAAAQSVVDESRPEALVERARTVAQSVTGRRTPQRSPATSGPADQRNPSSVTTSVDFNLAIGLLREHPPVLSSLGLLLELSVPAVTLGAWPAAGFLQVSWSAAPTDIPDIRPRWVAYQRRGFRLRPLDVRGPLVGGMVAIARPDSSWRVVSIEPEHALGGIEEAAQGNISTGLPALRTAGLLLLNPGTEGDLQTRMAASARARLLTDGGAESPLWAEDLVLGYRIDAKEQGGQWHSLTARRGDYSVNALTLVTDHPEEGQTKINAGVDHGDHTLSSTQVVVRWDGWSLAAPRPALTPGVVATPPDDPSSPTLPFHLGVDLVPEPQSLPRLVFGKDYQFRARVVDLAGGSLPLSAISPDNCESLPPVKFSRHEPVLPPSVDRVLDDAAEYGPGAALLTLVIREPPEGTASETPTPADTQRRLTPPSVGFEVADWHGIFARRTPTDGLALVTLPVLTDPAAGGVVTFVRGLPGEPARDRDDEAWVLGADGSPSAPIEIPAWPDLPPKQLVLMAKTDDQQATVGIESTGRFVVRLNPADEATVEVTSFIHASFLSSFAIKDWIAGTPDPADPAVPATKSSPAAPPAPPDVLLAEELLETGRHPMATPPVLVRVRHAVRRPLSTPSGTPVTTRPEHATYVDLSGPADNPLLGVDPASTISVDVTADWTPVEDLGDTPGVGRPVGRLQVDRGDIAVAALRHELGDTKHRLVTYHWAAVSRFRDCYGDADTAPDDFIVRGALGPVQVLSSAQPPPPVVRSVVPGFVWQDDGVVGGVHTRRRLGNRLRVQLGPWYATGDGERLAVLVALAGRVPAGPVTQAGRDATWTTATPPRYPKPLGTEITSISTPDGNAFTQLVTAWRSGDDWYADVAFENVASYGAMVQLVVARHQPNSLNGALTTSPAVMADFVSLLPDRQLSVATEPSGSAATVTLSGTTWPQGPTTNRVDVVLEQLWTSGPVPDGRPATVSDDGIWVHISSAQGQPGQAVRVVGPDASAPLRVRVREVEVINKASQTPSGLLGTIAELAERVVFTDTVVLQP